MVGGDRAADAHRTGTAARTVALAYSGEIQGYLAPCGCSKPMLGGMERRGAALARLRRAGPAIAVENGDLTEAAERQDELKAEALAAMLSELRYDAVAVGEKDLALGFQALISLQARAGTPFICANVDDASGNPLFGSSVTVTRKIGAGVLRVGIVAALSPRLADRAALPAGEFRIAAPYVALRRALAELKAVHTRVLLFHGLRDEASDLARRLPGLDLVVYAHGPDPPPPPVRVAKALLVGGGARGKALNVASVSTSGKVTGVGRIALGEAAGSDPAIGRLKRAYLDRVASEDLLGRMARVAAPGGATYAGSGACAPCHAGAARSWQSSRHATALRTLVARHEDRDPECVPCHVTGAQHEGGYRHGDDHLAGVGCESCHGPAAAHARSGSAPLPSRGGKAACLSCHVPDHSPSFRFEVYWPRIRH